MAPIKPTPSLTQRSMWTYLGRMLRWLPHMTKVMPRPEKTVRSPIHLNPRNKAPRGRSVATMGRQIGSKSLVEAVFRHRLTSLKLCWSAGNVPMPRSQTRISTTSNAKILWLMEDQAPMRQGIKQTQSTHNLLIWGSGLSRKSISPSTTSLLTELLAKLPVTEVASESRTDHMAFRKFSPSTSKRATNQRAFSWLLLFLTTTSWWLESRTSDQLMCFI